MGKGLIFKCSARSEEECLKRMLFAADSIAKDQVLCIETGDALFLLNLDTDVVKEGRDGGREGGGAGGWT